ncbi:hypothetical protein ABKN59_002008 [Abortiporus biennis]
MKNQATNLGRRVLDSGSIHAFQNARATFIIGVSCCAFLTIDSGCDDSFFLYANNPMFECVATCSDACSKMLQ